MAISLYDGSVAAYLQTLDAMVGVLDKGLAHCREQNLDPEEMVEASLFHDMRPLRFQVQNCAFHSLGATRAMLSGTLEFVRDRPAHDYAGLQSLIEEARAGLRALTPEEVNAREGMDVVFEVADNRRVFTTEGFLLSFSLPNFHFHATTAYDILRSRGVPLGKRDYMGALRLKP